MSGGCVAVGQGEIAVGRSDVLDVIEAGHGRVGIVMRPPACAAGAVRKTGRMAGSSIRILLVEADAPLRTLLAEVLREHGYTVAETADGRSALDAMRAVPDAVVLDLQLPHLAGPDFGRAPGAGPPVRKPFDVDQLLGAVHRVSHAHA